MYSLARLPSQHLSVTHLSAKLAGKLIKNPSLSAVRKCSREGRWIAAKAILYTGAIATTLQYVSFVMVDSLHVVYEEATRSGDARRKEGCGRRLIKVGNDNVKMFVSGVLGMAVGTVVWPGAGTAAGQILGECLPAFVS